MKPEVGKRYVRKDGLITGSLQNNCPDAGFFFYDPLHHKSYTDTGTEFYTKSSDADIVAEYAGVDVTATVDATGIGAPKPEAVRQFSTGATRNLDHNKLDYEGFNCPMAQRAFAEYMHGHRKQADGTIRDSANWQAGIPIDVYAKSLVRHVHDFHCLHRGWTIPRPEDGQPMTPDDEHKLELLCAIWFNVQGYIHELLKAKVKCESSSAG